MDKQRKQYNTIRSDNDPRSRTSHESHESYMLSQSSRRDYLSLAHAPAAQRSTATYIIGWDLHASSIESKNKEGVAER